MNLTLPKGQTIEKRIKEMEGQLENLKAQATLWGLLDAMGAKIEEESRLLEEVGKVDASTNTASASTTPSFSLPLTTNSTSTAPVTASTSTASTTAATDSPSRTAVAPTQAPATDKSTHDPIRWNTAASFSEVPSGKYGGLSEKAYLDLYFPDSIDVYARIMVGMVDCIQGDLERRMGIKADVTAQSQYALFKAIIGETIEYHCYGVPDRHDGPFRYVAERLKVRGEEKAVCIDVVSMAQITQDPMARTVWGECKKLAVPWRNYKELFCPMTAAILHELSFGLNDAHAPSLHRNSWEFKLDLADISAEMAARKRKDAGKTPLWKRLQSDRRGQYERIRAIIAKNGFAVYPRLISGPF